MPRPMTTKTCPRCDRGFIGVDSKAAFKAVSDHMDKAHPEMQNEIREEMEDEGFDNGGLT